MPFFIVYDPSQASNGPFLIGNRKGSRAKQFATYILADIRLRQCGRTAKNYSKIHQFDNLADATSYCVMTREARRSKIIVTVKKKPPGGGSAVSAEAQSTGLPVAVLSEPVP